MKKAKDTKKIKDTLSFEKLSELIGRVAILTFRGKSITQFKKYEIIGISEGFLRLKGIEEDVRRPRSAPYYQAVGEVDTIRLTEG